MADLINRLGAEAGRSLFGTIGGILRSHSLDGDAAGRLGENGYGILHDASITTQLLASAIQATARDVDPSRVGLTVDAQGMQLAGDLGQRSEEHTSELQSLMRTSYAVFCLKNNKHTILQTYTNGPEDY